METLGQQKLSLEEKVKELEETVAELEELQEVNDQLQEGFKEQELDFRQELDMKNMQIWEVSLIILCLGTIMEHIYLYLFIHMIIISYMTLFHFLICRHKGKLNNF